MLKNYYNLLFYSGNLTPFNLFGYQIFFFKSILLGRICCPEGKGTTGLQGPLQGAPSHPPPIYIRKTATAPYSYTNSAWVL